MTWVDSGYTEHRDDSHPGQEGAGQHEVLAHYVEWCAKERTDSDQRVEGRGITGKKRGKVKSRNMYEGPMDEDGRGREDWMWEVGARKKIGPKNSINIISFTPQTLFVFHLLSE